MTDRTYWKPEPDAAFIKRICAYWTSVKQHGTTEGLTYPTRDVVPVTDEEFNRDLRDCTKDFGFDGSTL